MDYANEMRKLITSIATYARQLNPKFIIIAQNVPNLMMLNQNDDAFTGSVDTNFMNSINAWSIEELFFGNVQDDLASPTSFTNNLIAYANRAKTVFKHQIFVVDYVYTAGKVFQSALKNRILSYLGLQLNRSVSSVPAFPRPLPDQNPNSVTRLQDVKNWLYLVNPVKFVNKFDYLVSLRATYYDLVVISPFFNNTLLTQNDMGLLKSKLNGARRPVICLMSIGEAQNYTPYWQASWSACSGFIDSANPYASGSFRVKYWNAAWKNLLYGDTSSLMYSLVKTGCDGVYLDGLESFAYFSTSNGTCSKT
jgi:cysteinyl-tRNA synthetase